MGIILLESGSNTLLESAWDMLKEDGAAAPRGPTIATVGEAIGHLIGQSPLQAISPAAAAVVTPSSPFVVVPEIAEPEIED